MSNYRGKVFRRIARAKRGQVNVRGATIVTLTIGPTGQLTGVGVARSSGSARLDEIAVIPDLDGRDRVVAARLQAV